MARVLTVLLLSQFMASINKLVIGYEADARKDRRRVEVARKDAALLKNKLDEVECKHAAELASASARIKVFEDEQKKLREEHDQVASLAIRLEVSKEKKIAKVVSLKRQIEANNALHEANMKRAQKGRGES